MGTKYKIKHPIVPHTLAVKRSAYLPLVIIICSGTMPSASTTPTRTPNPIDKWKESEGAGINHSKNIGASPNTIVPLTVVAESTSGLAKTGSVPIITRTTIIILPLDTEGFLAGKMSTTMSLEKDENAESKVDAAEVIIIKFMASIAPVPSIFPTCTGAEPCTPSSPANTPISPKTNKHRKPITVASM